MAEVGCPIKRVAVSTGGGDAPGLNAVIRSVTLAGRNQDWDVVGIRDGFNGLMFPERYPQGGVVPLTQDSVRGILNQGGTIIGTTNRGNPTAYPVVQPDGTQTIYGPEVGSRSKSAVCQRLCRSVMRWYNSALTNADVEAPNRGALLAFGLIRILIGA